MPATAPSRQPVPTVLVTGAAKRLGREIALALAAAGWRVAVHYRGSLEDATKTVVDCSALTRGAAAFCADLSDESGARDLLPTVIQSLGHVDAVVNSASTFEHDTSATFSFAALEKHMRSNAGAPIVLAQALHAHIAARQQTALQDVPPPIGAVVNLLDQKLWNQNPDFISYTLSKAALEAANTMLALALSPQVRVVGVAPGLIAGISADTEAGFLLRVDGPPAAETQPVRVTYRGAGCTPDEVTLAPGPVRLEIDNATEAYIRLAARTIGATPG